MIQKVRTERLEICSLCENNSKFRPNILRPDYHCVLCGCTLSAKTSCLSCECDVHKWSSVMTPEQEEEMTEDE